MGGSESKEDKEEENLGARFTEDKEYRLYRLVDTNSNGGELLPWMRYALNTGDYSLIDGYLDSKLKEFMYNGGKGKLESVAELVKIRNKERNAMLGAFSRKKGKGKSGPNILDDFNQEGNQGDLKKALKLLDGGKSGKGDAKYREIVWKLEDRGRMGENIVGACLMQGSALHNKLAIKILTAYPKLINDIFISEEYYGLSHLHQSIVNEDPYMTNYLLQHGADINQRCYGAFFCPNDQKGGRTDSLEHEYVELPEKTNYLGRTYFGEYPLAFAACTNQRDCYRLLRAKRADPNQKDTNGNTVLHMTVIHENLEMLKLAYDTGAKLQVMNKQNLTPLTLAAKIAKKKMFEQILQLESTVVWNYGEASSVAYPLAKLDTINQETGHLNEDSALFLAAYGETQEHLDMLDGLLENLLQAKWDAFAKRRWSISLFCFIVYFIFVFIAFMNRPFSITTMVLTNSSIYYWDMKSTIDPAFLDFSVNPSLQNMYSPRPVNSYKEFTDYGYEQERCHLTSYLNQGYQGYARLVAETFVIVAVVYQVIAEILEIRAIKFKRWWQILSSFPFKILYRISMIFVLLLVPIRALCFLGDYMLFLDNMFSIFIVIMTALHFLFYFRAMKFLGPFVVMIYTIFLRDMIRFFAIYSIFLVGFSHAFYLIFVACERARIARNEDRLNILENILEGVLRLFICTIGEFTVFYKEINQCEDFAAAQIGKVVFLVYELCVSLLQFNLLIAMMTRTYELIYRTQKEYKRQWAQVILMTELSLPPKDRLMALLKYSRPIGTDKRKRAFVVTRNHETFSESEKLMKEQQANAIREEKRLLLKRRLKDIHQANPNHQRIAGKMGFRPETPYIPTPMPPTRWTNLTKNNK